MKLIKQFNWLILEIRNEFNMDIKKLSTEGRNPATMNLDEMSADRIVAVMNSEDKKVAVAVEKQLPQISTAANKIAEAFKAGGRLFYTGAGTSGRLGVLDAAECVPTLALSLKWYKD